MSLVELGWKRKGDSEGWGEDEKRQCRMGNGLWRMSGKL
jgi:hypothetical protein